jgi:hypothetical protein
MNKGRAYRIPGIGLAGDWPGDADLSAPHPRSMTR